MKQKVFIFILGLIGLNFILHSNVLAIKEKEKYSIPNLQIGVISDVHIGDKKEKDMFTRALNDYKNIAPNLKVLAMVGDITNNGLESQYDEFMYLLNKNLDSNIERVISIGNHEYYERGVFPESKVTDKELSDRFVKKTGMPSLYYDKWIEGYHFIALGGEESMISDMANGDTPIISETQYRWLKKVLEVHDKDNKPIFIFLHQPIYNTVYGSSESGELKDEKLMEILKGYPQSILFSGHSHYILNHPKSIYEDGFTMVNTSSIAYTCSEKGEEDSKYSQGLLLNIYGDRVEIKSREFTNNTWINTNVIKNK